MFPSPTAKVSKLQPVDWPFVFVISLIGSQACIHIFFSFFFFYILLMAAFAPQWQK